MDKDHEVIVCAACQRATCWHGTFMCDESKWADITTLPVSELRKLKLEHPSYWTKEYYDKNVLGVTK